MIFYKAVLFIATLSSLYMTSVSSHCPDAYDLTYTLPLFEQCKVKMVDGDMVQTIPKLLPGSAHQSCNQRQNGGIPEGRRICRVPECLQQPCQNGWCEETMVRYTCHCQTGYTGENCETKMPTIKTDDGTTSSTERVVTKENASSEEPSTLLSTQAIETVSTAAISATYPTPHEDITTESTAATTITTYTDLKPQEDKTTGNPTTVTAEVTPSASADDDEDDEDDETGATVSPTQPDGTAAASKSATDDLTNPEDGMTSTDQSLQHESSSMSSMSASSSVIENGSTEHESSSMSSISSSSSFQGNYTAVYESSSMSSISSSSSIIGNDSGEMKTNEYDNVTAGNTDAFTIKRNDSTLYISCPDTTWDNAEDLCADREGRLIVPSSESLLETVVDSVSDACLEKHADGGEVELWLGCRLLKVDEENGKDLKLVDQWACRNDSSDDSGFSSMVTLYNWTANYKVSGISRDDKVCLQVKTKRGRHADDQNKYEFKREYCDNRKAKAVCILD